MTKKQPESKLFNLKPQLTLAMKLAATFAITYYGLLLLYEIATLVFSRYFIDSIYLGTGDAAQGRDDYVVLVLQLLLSSLLVFSLISIFLKKSYGKALFVGGSILLIVFQLFTTGLMPPLKYILEVLMLLVIAPLRVKKKIKIKEGKITVEEVDEVKCEAFDEVKSERLEGERCPSTSSGTIEGEVEQTDQSPETNG